MLTFQNYKRPQTLEEAWTLNQSKSARLAAGMMWMRMGDAQIGTVVDLCGLGLDHLEETQDAFLIGAMVPLRIGVQLRNTATVGGSVWGRFGFSDVITLLLAMDTLVVLYCGPKEGNRIMTLDDFTQEAADKPAGAILTQIIVRKEKAAFDYRSVRRTATDFPILTEAAAKLDDGSWRFAVGARPQIAIQVQVAPDLVTRDSMNEIITTLCQNIETGTNIRGSAEYRTHLIGVLMERSIRKLTGI